jgi:methyl-accepting chemotaxis protein
MLWVCLCMVVMCTYEVLSYLHFREYWNEMLSHAPEYRASFSAHQREFLISMWSEIIFFSTGILVLAVMASHRAGGPLLALKRSFSEVTKGNLGYRLRFRSYDRLDDVELAFNRMMDAVQQRCERQEAEGAKATAA